MDSSVSLKEEIWFLRVCHHISIGLYFKYIKIIFTSSGSFLENVIKIIVSLLAQLTDYFMVIKRQPGG